VHLTECPSLEYLHVPRTITDDGLIHLARITGLKYLWATTGSTGPLSDKGLERISTLPVLEELTVEGGNGITDVGLGYLARLRRLKRLNLVSESPGITNRGFAEIAKLSRLERLAVCLPTMESGVTLAGLNHFNALTELRVLEVLTLTLKRDNSILDISALRQLEELSLGFEEMRDEDLACLTGLTQLRRLQNARGISDAGMAHLAGLTRMEHMGIGGPQLTDNGLRYVANMKMMDNLTLGGDFSEAGLRQLEGLKSLTRLNIKSSDPSSGRAEEWLLQALPNLVSFNGRPILGTVPSGTG